MTTFVAQVSKRIAESLKDIRSIAGGAIQDVVQAAQTSQPSASRTGGTFEVGKIPVLSNDLRESLVSGGVAGSESYGVAIANMEIGDILHFEWTQPYAMRIEYGFTGADSLGRTYNQAGRHFVGFNAARFPEFVAARVKEVE